MLGLDVTQAFEDDVLIEKTFDYFAQDTGGNVWYLGEDVTNYRYDDDGDFLGTDDESAWRAGFNGALPGWLMPASTEIGLAYYQEYAPQDDALDEGLTSAMLAQLSVGGQQYADVLRVLETSQLDPEARDYKYYAPGVGLIREEEHLDASFANPELTFNRTPFAPVPLPAPLAMLVAAVAGLSALRRTKKAPAGADA